MARRWNDLPLSYKLTLLYVGLLAALLGALGVVLYLDTAHFLIHTTAVRLRAQAKPTIERWLPGWSAGEEEPTPPAPGPAPPPGAPGPPGPPAPAPPDDKAETTSSSFLDRIAGQLSRALTSRDTTALVLDDSGKLLASGRRLPEEPLPASPDPQYVSRALAGENEVTYITSVNGVRSLVLLIPLRRAPGERKVVGVVELTTPLSLIDAVLWRQRLLIGLGVILTLGLGTLGGLWITRSALTPLQRMISTCRAIAAGDLSQRVNLPARRDEVGQLAAAFDNMVAQIERTFAAQKRFVAAAAHELRTPLTALRGSLEVLLRGAQDEPATAARLVQGMYREVTRLIRLAEQLLDITRLDSPVIIHRQPVELARFLTGFLDQARRLAGERSVTLTPGEDVTISADPDALKQVLFNLVDNAIKHTSPDGRIDIGWEVTDDEIAIWVADNGAGIAPDDLPHVFEPFYRGDRSRSRRRGGAGLGLSLVRAVVEAHGGRVEVESELNTGTRVTVKLPRSA